MLCLCLAVVVAFLVLVLCSYLISINVSPYYLDLKDKHVMVTGGSSGIGRSLAIAAVKKGARVTLIARDSAKLEATKVMIDQVAPHMSTSMVQCVSIDMTLSQQVISLAIHEVHETFGPVDVLVNCAGTSLAKEFQETSEEEFRSLLDLNVMGSVCATQSVLPSMIARKCGRIVFVSSQAGQIGLYGYTAYSASKFALRGIAEALQMEVRPYDIRVTVAFPPDTDTPGLQKENRSKPAATRLISETAGLFTADHVAERILTDVSRGKFTSYLGLDGWMLASVTAGMSPVTSLFEAIQQVIAMGVLRLVGLFYLNYFNHIVFRTVKNKMV